MRRDSEQVLTEWLVLHAQAGRTEAMDQLLRRWYPKLLRYSQWQLRDQDAAHDAVQETLLVVARKLRGLRDPAAFPKWVYQVLHRNGLGWQRKEARRRDREQKAGAGDAEMTVDSEEQTAIEHDMARVLHRAIGSLGDLGYNVIHLHYLHGFTVREIAEICDVAEGTVKSRLRLARAKLKDKLEATT